MLEHESRIGLLFSLIVCISIAAACGGRMPKALEDGSGRLAPCPDSPNCVSSEATDEVHAISAYRIQGDASTASWKALESHLADLPRVVVVTDEDGYLYAVFTTRLMHYRDDVEFGLDAETGVIHVRSASRVGYGDMGVNRERIESIRAVLAGRGLIEPLATR